MVKDAYGKPVVRQKNEAQSVGGYDTYGLNFSQADSSQEQALREIEELYRNGGDWVSAANGLQTTGNFVSAPNEGGAPTGAYRSISGETNGSMLWGLDGKMANTGVSEGTQLIAPDGSYWKVGAGGELTPYQAAVAAADAGNGGMPGSSYSASGSASYSASGGSASNPYAAAIDAFDYGPAPAWGGSDYERLRDEAAARARDMKFSYDPNTDPSWLAYQKQFRREGQRATANALGQAAAMTGGNPSSYAVTAASQAGDYYASQLSDKIPQLYQDAYNRYLQEYQRQMGIADTYAGYGQTEYSRYLDRLGQYNTDRSFAYGQYRDQIGDQRYADETAYARSRDALSDQRYDTQWAQELREYEDKMAQQALENGWYERQYGDEQAQQRLKNALAFYSEFGYIPEEYADLFSSWAGMGQQAQTPQTVVLTDPPKTPPKTLEPVVLTENENTLLQDVIAAVERGQMSRDEADALLSRMGMGTLRDYGLESLDSLMVKVNLPGSKQIDKASGGNIPTSGANEILMSVYDAVENGRMTEAEANDILTRNGLNEYRSYVFTSEQGRDLIAGYKGEKSANFDRAAQALIDEYNRNPGKDVALLLRQARTYNLTDDEYEYLARRFGAI